MALNPERIGGEFYAELRTHYSDAEIVELGTFIGFNIGYHTFFGTLKFYPMFAPDGRLVSQEESARIYGTAPASLAPATASPTTPARRATPPTTSPLSHHPVTSGDTPPQAGGEAAGGEAAGGE